MRGLVLVGVVGLTGCDGVFGLERDGYPDAPDEPDIDAAQPPTDGGIPAGTCWNPIQVAPIQDEDGDTVLDHCDNCPSRGNMDQRDEDRDGVGDICDPHPLLAIEKLVYFDGFNAVAPGTSFGGSWTWNGLGMAQSNTNNLALYLLTTPVFRRPTIDAPYANDMPGANAEWQFGVMAINDPPATIDARPDGLRCSELIFTSAADEVRVDRLVGGVNVTSTRALIAGGSFPRTARLSYDWMSGEATCNIDRVTINSTASLGRAPGDAERVGIGLWTRLSGLTFQSVTVYETIWPPE